MKFLIVTLAISLSGATNAWARTVVSVKGLNTVLAKNNGKLRRCMDLQVKVIKNGVYLSSGTEYGDMRFSKTLAKPATENIPVQVTNFPNGVREFKIETTNKGIGRRQGDLTDHSIMIHDITYIKIGPGGLLLDIDIETFEKHSFFEGWISPYGGRRGFCD